MQAGGTYIRDNLKSKKVWEREKYTEGLILKLSWEDKK